MATTVVMPKLGQSVESCILVEWKKQVGEQVAADDPLCEVETDKTTMEVPAPIAGILLAIFYQVGDEVPVMTPLVLIGAGLGIGIAFYRRVAPLFDGGIIFAPAPRIDTGFDVGESGNCCG